MARFLFSVWLTPGHMYPAVAVARGLAARGHAVAFHTDPAHAELLAPLGIGLVPLAGVPGLDDPAVRPREEPPGPAAMKAAFRARFVARIPADLASLRRALAAWRPDVLVNDPVSLAPLIASEAHGIPVATLNNVIFSWPGAAMAPYGLGLPPACDAATRTRYAAMRQRAKDFYADIIEAINAERRRHGLAPRNGSLAEATLSPYLHLIPTIPELDYNRTDLPAQVHHVGPCLFDPPAHGQSEAVERFLAGLPAERPLVVAAASSVFARSAALVETALQALISERGEHDRAPAPGDTADSAPGDAAAPALLATLPFDHPLHGSAFPSAVHLTRYAPHSSVLPRASAVITHGGFGMVTKALSYGLPLVIVPYAADQPEVAQRAVAAGVARRLNPDTLTPHALREALRAVQQDSFRRRAMNLGAALRACDGPGAAARLLEQLAATGRPVARAAYMRARDEAAMAAPGAQIPRQEAARGALPV